MPKTEKDKKPKKLTPGKVKQMLRRADLRAEQDRRDVRECWNSCQPNIASRWPGDPSQVRSWSEGDEQFLIDSRVVYISDESETGGPRVAGMMICRVDPERKFGHIEVLAVTLTGDLNRDRLRLRATVAETLLALANDLEDDATIVGTVPLVTGDDIPSYTILIAEELRFPHTDRGGFRSWSFTPIQARAALRTFVVGAVTADDGVIL